ncbi:Outer membrane receptor proteins, mostly Fe transport [Saccharicrinis carchari]|uniref:Outer membrane receptor proteins, mostly Fe transport n=1 Tax=Saccharicrinis carchari TaxID=1168039 RepID=A0A521AED7_SACCC|nr:TonB-dependent receptor [Saccharicrinis carchari]SMO33172.1 Outer membrane receptor proteins, mostly Fe transport [Saccharicrinis carchari]
MKLTSLVFFILILSVSALNGQSTGEIKGWIISEEGSALDHVNLSVVETGKGTYSDEKGYFSINDIAPGDYTLEASAIGYATAQKRIKLEALETTTVNISLKKLRFQLSGITVKGGALQNRNSPASISTVHLNSIKKLHLSNPQQILYQVPGVEIGAYNQGGTADVFTMRGFSGGGHEGQAAIEVDGISLNEGEGSHDGYADMNLIIPLNISKVDVYKGPSSVLFGRYAMAGTLSFETRKDGEYQDLSLKGGSFETFDGQIALGKPFELGDNTLRTNFAAQLYRTKGFTENAEFLKGNLNGRVAYDVGDHTDIALNLKGYSGTWDAPGYIPGEQFNELDRRNKQALNAENDGGAKNFASERLDVNHSFNENLRLLVFGYAVQQDYQRYAKFSYQPGGQSENNNKRNVYAVGANLNGKHAFGFMDVNWVGGLEFYNEMTNSKRWGTENRVRRALRQKRNYNLQSFSAFAQGEFEISTYFRPTVGLRYDVYNGTLELRDPGVAEENKSLNDLSHVSPKIGFRSTLFPGFDFKANVSNGFIIPPSAIRYNSDMDVDPAEIWQYEAGIVYGRSSFFNVNLTGFILNTSKEISETAPGSGEFFNSGTTQRRGLEMGLKAQPFDRFHITASFAYTSTEVMDNVNKDLEGKELTNIPRTVTSLSLDYTLKYGFGARINMRDIGKYATGQTNSFFYEGYTVADAALFYNLGSNSSHSGQFFVELNNMFDLNYATYVFDLGQGQSYGPAPLRNFTIGVAYNL